MGATIFGIKQKIAGFIGSVVSIVILVVVVQGGLFFYKAKANLDKQMDAAMSTRLVELNKEPMSNVLQAKASFRAMVVDGIRNAAGSYLGDPEQIDYRFVSLGQSRNIDEDMVERCRLSYRYPAGFKLLWALPINLSFSNDVEVLVKPNGGLSAYVKKQ